MQQFGQFDSIIGLFANITQSKRGFALLINLGWLFAFVSFPFDKFEKYSTAFRKEGQRDLYSIMLGKKFYYCYFVVLVIVWMFQ